MIAKTNALPIGHALHRYRIEAVLGAGGFGITYKAVHEALETHTAIKEYFPVEWAYRDSDGVTVHVNTIGHNPSKPGEDTSWYDWGLLRFLDEAKVLVRIHHDGVVRVQDFFTAYGTAYIVMEYEEGEPLSARLKRERTLSEADLRDLLTQTLDALQAVHRAQYLHRDLKPSNLYLRARDRQVMLIDFGSARQTLGRRTMTSMYTPGYAPIEQYTESSKHYGPWTDIYSLGAVLYRCIAGAPPADASVRVIEDSLRPAREVGAGRYDETLLAAIDRALAVQPEERFASIEQFTAELSRTRDQTKTFTPWKISSVVALLVVLVVAGVYHYTHLQVEGVQGPAEQSAKALAAEHDQWQAEFEARRQELAESQQNLAKQRTENQTLEAAVSRLEKERAASEDQLQDAQTIIKTLTENRDALLSQLHDAQQDHTRLSAQLTKAQQALDSLIAERDRLQTTLEVSLGEISKGLQVRPETIEAPELPGSDSTKPGKPVTPGQAAEDCTQRADVINPTMIPILAGSFIMGSPADEEGRGRYERQHRAQVDAFMMGEFEVTFAEYDCFAETTGQRKPRDYILDRGKRPVVGISWHEAVAYIEWLSRRTGENYRLPTEVEWEYAARAGTTTPFHFGATISSEQANYNGEETTPVGSFPANAWGFHDMHGNVGEWTCSEYDPDYGGAERQCLDKAGALPVARGGSWANDPEEVRSAYRLVLKPEDRLSTVGFRLARSL